MSTKPPGARVKPWSTSPNTKLTPDDADGLFTPSRSLMDPSIGHQLTRPDGGETQLGTGVLVDVCVGVCVGVTVAGWTIVGVLVSRGVFVGELVGCGVFV